MTDVRGNSGNDLLRYCRVDIENSHVKSASRVCPRLKQLAISIRPVNENKKKEAYRLTFHGDESLKIWHINVATLSPSSASNFAEFAVHLTLPRVNERNVLPGFTF